MCLYILQEEVITALSSISRNLHGLFADFTASSAFVCLDLDLTRLQRETETLCKNTEFLLGSQLHATHQGDSIKTHLFSNAYISDDSNQ